MSLVATPRTPRLAQALCVLKIRNQRALEHALRSIGLPAYGPFLTQTRGAVLEQLSQWEPERGLEVLFHVYAANVENVPKDVLEDLIVSKFSTRVVSVLAG